MPDVILSVPILECTVTLDVYKRQAVTLSQIALRVGFRTEALGFEQLLHLQFVAGGSLRQIVGRILVRRCV